MADVGYCRARAALQGSGIDSAVSRFYEENGLIRSIGR